MSLVRVLKKIMASKVLRFPQKQKIVEKEYSFKFDDKFLLDNTPIRSQELDVLDKEVDRITELIDQCDPNYDQDVLENLTEYLEKIEERIQRDMDNNDKNDVKDKKVLKKLKVIK